MDNSSEFENYEIKISYLAKKLGYSEFYVSPNDYRKNPVPVVLRTVIKPFDCYLLGMGGTGVEIRPIRKITDPV